ncbi:hypothetical protein ACRB68_50190 [Actinomadura sp. RB68]|uniref:histidine kinase n=1 Tax=Actinomadura macrotermitis TaxID=2585200 RepID=A0A7K0C1H0_9ACTN|nr:hypothetical protein [Actinomadura macrotermitis]
MWVAPALLVFVQVSGSMGAQDSHHGWESEQTRVRHQKPLDEYAFALLVAGPLLLLLRRRYPRFTLTAEGVVTALYFLRAYTYGPAAFSAGVAIIAAVTAGHRLFAWAGTLGAISAYLAGTALYGLPPELRGDPHRLFPVERPGLDGTVFLIGWALLALVGAELIRARRQRAEAAARTRAEAERRQATEERLRMARELHDVLAHNISMINVRAGVALHLLSDDAAGDAAAAEARDALAAIKVASKEALSEMRSVIGALRADGEQAPRSPTAGLDRLPELLERARAAGLAVHCEVSGEERPLPAGADLAAFRIVQESLTNVTRHAGPGPVRVRVRIVHGDHDVTVRVDDDGRGAPLLSDTGGAGIRGMRERATALGGTFDAGPRAGGGFRVRATLPLDGES